MKRPPQLISIQYYASPCGELILASIDEQLCLCDWNEKACAERNKRRLQRLLNATFVVKTSSVIESARLQLDQYFAGKRKTFDMPLLLVGTDFQQSVWKALLRIPYGKTLSYKEVAQSIGNPMRGFISCSRTCTPTPTSASASCCGGPTCTPSTSQPISAPCSASTRNATSTTSTC